MKLKNGAVLKRYEKGLNRDIERLRFFAGIHPNINGRFRVLSRSFPFSIYYQVIKEQVLILAVLDNRQNPKSIEHRLTNS
jgi:plasmid stabilization system protein ParE